MTDFSSGMYRAATDKRVTVWPAPDANGNGEEVWRTKTDAAGNQIGRERVTDNNGRPVKNYLPPEGFTNVPSFDHSDNYVRTRENGSIHRNVNGEAVSIRPGTVLVEYPNGTHELIEDEYQVYLFTQSHEKTGETQQTPADVVAEKRDDTASREERMAQLRAELAQLEEEDSER